MMPASEKLSCRRMPPMVTSTTRRAGFVVFPAAARRWATASERKLRNDLREAITAEPPSSILEATRAPKDVDFGSDILEGWGAGRERSRRSRRRDRWWRARG